jgi:hypothetical protein
MVVATIEDLANPTVLRGYLTKSDGGVVLSMTFLMDLKLGISTGTEVKETKYGVNERSSQEQSHSQKQNF